MNRTLEKKIDELFYYRKFPELFEQANQKYKKHPLVKSLKNLQANIYYLDHHLETNWKINPTRDLKPYWKAIYQSLKECGVKKKDYDDYCKLIYKYQKHELYLRHNKLPISFNMEFYYYFKSCDVKLLRRIICDHYPILKTKYPDANWRYFDLVTEVNDDIEDVFEDMETINGNYFLIDILKNGLPKAKSRFTQFLQVIKTQDKLRLKKYRNQYQWCSQLTQQECLNTVRLLRTNLKTIKGTSIETKIGAYI